MDWVTIGAAVLAVWAAATVVGAERQRRIDQTEAEAAALAALANPVPASANPPVAH